MDQITKNIGENLKRIRQERGISLEKTAELTGVSKAMLGQIERGDSNPTVTTLWKIANGLRMSFSSLIHQEQPSVTLIKKEEVEPLKGDGGRYNVYPFIPFDPEKQFEVYFMTLEPGAAHESEPHHTGVEEYIFVNDGTLDVEVNGNLYTVQTDDAIRFDGDRHHTYRNNGQGVMKCLVVIHYAQ